MPDSIPANLKEILSSKSKITDIAPSFPSLPFREGSHSDLALILLLALRKAEDGVSNIQIAYAALTAIRLFAQTTEDKIKELREVISDPETDINDAIAASEACAGLSQVRSSMGIAFGITKATIGFLGQRSKAPYDPVINPELAATLDLSASTTGEFRQLLSALLSQDAI